MKTYHAAHHSLAVCMSRFPVLTSIVVTLACVVMNAQSGQPPQLVNGPWRVAFERTSELKHPLLLVVDGNRLTGTFAMRQLSGQFVDGKLVAVSVPVVGDDWQVRFDGTLAADGSLTGRQVLTWIDSSGIPHTRSLAFVATRAPSR
jgi:hypothetical protein